MYAIVRTGGKQYRVEEGRTITIDRLSAEEGETVELGDVLLIADDGNVTVGAPLIEGARVMAEVEANGRAKKIIVFKYRAKVRTRKKTGHRQRFTRLAVREILRPGEESKAAKPEPRRRKAEAEAAVEAPAAEVAVEAVAPAKRRTRKAAEPAVAEKATTKGRATRKAATPKAETAAAPKRRTTRKAAPKAEASTAKPRARRKATETGAAEGKPKATRRRTARPKTGEGSE